MVAKKPNLEDDIRKIKIACLKGKIAIERGDITAEAEIRLIESSLLAIEQYERAKRPKVQGGKND